jgi:hypothetical protein
MIETPCSFLFLCDICTGVGCVCMEGIRWLDNESASSLVLCDLRCDTPHEWKASYIEDVMMELSLLEKMQLVANSVNGKNLYPSLYAHSLQTLVTTNTRLKFLS